MVPEETRARAGNVKRANMRYYAKILLGSRFAHDKS